MPQYTVLNFMISAYFRSYV